MSGAAAGSKQAAFHEAAHVIVAYALGLHIRGVTVPSQMNEQGSHGWTDVEDGPDTWQAHYAHAACSLAGEVAEEKYRGHPPVMPGESRFYGRSLNDRFDAHECCDKVLDSGGSPYTTPQDAYDAALAMARRVLDQHAGPHCALTAVLEELRILDERQVKVVLGVLLDGRSYDSEELVQAAVAEAVERATTRQQDPHQGR